MAKHRIDVKLLLASLGIAVGIVLVIVGVNTSVTGREQQQLPDAIEEVSPIRGATQVLQQTQIQADLLPGYDEVLVVNGTELPVFSLDDVSTPTSAAAGGQAGEFLLPKAAIIEPGNNTITYTPVEGAPIERFETGLNTATVIYWKVDEGRANARSYTWTFTVV